MLCQITLDQIPGFICGKPVNNCTWLECLGSGFLNVLDQEFSMFWIRISQCFGSGFLNVLDQEFSMFWIRSSQSFGSGFVIVLDQDFFKHCYNPRYHYQDQDALSNNAVSDPWLHLRKTCEQLYMVRMFWIRIFKILLITHNIFIIHLVKTWKQFTITMFRISFSRIQMCSYNSIFCKTYSKNVCYAP